MDGTQPAGGVPAHPVAGPQDGLGPLGLDLLGLSSTRAAALACQPWVGRGDGHRADEAATEAMRSVLLRAPAIGTVVVGEGAKDGAPMLAVGERLGDGSGPEFEIAVDPLECTKLCAAGLPGSLATIAFAPAGAMAPLGAAFYMDKLIGAVPAAVPGVAFLSGGQRDEDAIANLNACNSLGRQLPWRLTFSFGRALLATALEVWAGSEDNVVAAQAVVASRARASGLASLGCYVREFEPALA